MVGESSHEASKAHCRGRDGRGLYIYVGKCEQKQLGAVGEDEKNKEKKTILSSLNTINPKRVILDFIIYEMHTKW